MKMEHRVVGVHRHDRIQVAPRPRHPVTNSQVLNLSAHPDPPSITRSNGHYSGLGRSAPSARSHSDARAFGNVPGSLIRVVAGTRPSGSRSARGVESPPCEWTDST